MKRRYLGWLLAALFFVPLVSHTLYWSVRGWPDHWREADYSSSGDWPTDYDEALVRVYCARIGGWLGAVAEHCWLTYQRAGEAEYTRWEVVGWEEPVRKNAYGTPDGRLYSNDPQRVMSVSGAKAAKAIDRLEGLIRAYPFNQTGDYRRFPGPNSDTFIAHLVRQTPELEGALPPTAIGRSYPVDGWVAPSPSKSGVTVSAGGWAALTLAGAEGVEVEFLGQTLGVGFQPLALKLPGVGWLRPAPAKAAPGTNNPGTSTPASTTPVEEIPG